MAYTNTELERQYFLQLARAYIRTTPEKHDEIAAYCLSARERGDNASVWHASAQVHGLDVCQCATCRAAHNAA